MTHKELLSEIHKTTKIDRQQISAMMSAMVRILCDEAISGNVVEISGLGQFISHKHPEYIHTNEATGESVLYPPRISYRFSPLSNFDSVSTATDLLSDYTGITEDEAMRFLNSLTSSILSHINEGEEVEILGLGKFVLVDTNQTEMRRVALILSETMKKDVNAPFAYFEPYVISKDVPEEKPIDDNVTREKPIDDEVFQPKEEERIQPLNPLKGTIKENTAPKFPKGDNNNAFAFIITKKKTLWLYVLPLLLLAFAVIVCLYSTYPARQQSVVETYSDTSSKVVHVLSPLGDLGTHKEEIAEVVPTIITDTDSYKHRLVGPDGNPVTIKLASGGRLTLVALEYFGSKDFWPYIFDVNSDKLKSPNLVSAGMTLYLPDPVFYDIDSLSQSSLKKARRRANDLISSPQPSP